MVTAFLMIGVACLNITFAAADGGAGRPEKVPAGPLPAKRGDCCLRRRLPRTYGGLVDAVDLTGIGIVRNLMAMEETLFSKIIARKIPAKLAYEDERYIAIHDISPQAPVHLLVITKKVIATLNDLGAADAELVGGMFLVAAKLMKQMGHSDYRTVFNCGPGAQQTVLHLHLHVLSGRPFTWPPG